MLIAMLALGVLLLLLITTGIYFATEFNPYERLRNTVTKSHKNSLFYGTEIEVYDDKNVNGISRLLLIKPTNIIVYNRDNTVYAYLQNSVGSTCGRNEYQVIAINRDNISDVTDGIFKIVCTTISDYNLLEYFINETPVLTLNPTYDTELFTIVDVINYCLLNGVLNFN
ncbi:hypothetical protein [Neodiprion abietis nucleopolyhedrovirus]|uniref:Uncharacterized protein n=1 Tax=Neodiprion abietis nucleopolyhedrovirus TaxID=204507 RepID=Q0ZP20_9CBAC|nr:hypothetical protein [Neodiprion abietis nucleopolyhedrovirus]ABC74934.1 unknown [Neodiprion abietis nucleopolyhedrovirus]